MINDKRNAKLSFHQLPVKLHGANPNFTGHSTSRSCIEVCPHQWNLNSSHLYARPRIRWFKPAILLALGGSYGPPNQFRSRSVKHSRSYGHWDWSWLQMVGCEMRFFQRLNSPTRIGRTLFINSNDFGIYARFISNERGRLLSSFDCRTLNKRE